MASRMLRKKGGLHMEKAKLSPSMTAGRRTPPGSAAASPAARPAARGECLPSVVLAGSAGGQAGTPGACAVGRRPPASPPSAAAAGACAPHKHAKHASNSHQPPRHQLPRPPPRPGASSCAASLAAQMPPASQGPTWGTTTTHTPQLPLSCRQRPRALRRAAATRAAGWLTPPQARLGCPAGGPAAGWLPGWQLHWRGRPRPRLCRPWSSRA